jgi:cation transport ATPase
MELVKPEFGIWFYVVSVVVSGLLFFGWRRLFRRLFRAEAVVVIATAMAAIITTPMVLLALLWVLHTLAV